MRGLGWGLGRGTVYIVNDSFDQICIFGYISEPHMGTSNTHTYHITYVNTRIRLYKFVYISNYIFIHMYTYLYICHLARYRNHVLIHN